jgi:hypothetical protein
MQWDSQAFAQITSELELEDGEGEGEGVRQDSVSRHSSADASVMGGEQEQQQQQQQQQEEGAAGRITVSELARRHRRGGSPGGRSRLRTREKEEIGELTPRRANWKTSTKVDYS